MPIAMVDRLPRRLIRWYNILIQSGTPLSIRVAEPTRSSNLEPDRQLALIEDLPSERVAL
ncbi:MAG: hypothetical protein NVSMB5_12400 [Candidatus Velthaea sp.]